MRRLNCQVERRPESNQKPKSKNTANTSKELAKVEVNLSSIAKSNFTGRNKKHFREFD
jgi:hypothetical protein